MIKKISVLLIIGTTLILWSCKKESAIDKIDPKANDVVMAPESIPNPEPNIGGPPMTDVAPTPTSVNGKFPIMSFEKKEHDFGVINEGDKVNYSYTFKNTGESDLIISSAVGSCGCTVPEYPKKPLKPGDSAKMKVSFNSSGKSGQQQKTITINANTVAGKETLTIKATVTPKSEENSGITSH